MQKPTWFPQLVNQKKLQKPKWVSAYFLFQIKKLQNPMLVSETF